MSQFFKKKIEVFSFMFFNESATFLISWKIDHDSRSFLRYPRRDIVLSGVSVSVLSLLSLPQRYAMERIIRPESSDSAVLRVAPQRTVTSEVARHWRRVSARILVHGREVPCPALPCYCGRPVVFLEWFRTPQTSLLDVAARSRGQPGPSRRGRGNLHDRCG